MSYDEFIGKWAHRDYPPKAVAMIELARAEEKIGASFPNVFRRELCAHGAASTGIGLLNAIVDRNLDLSDVQELLTPAEIVETTQTWRELGLASDVAAFAKDCSGNLFCFRRGSNAIWFWDHDFQDLEQVAPDFEKWISRYNKIKPLADND